MNVGTKLWKYDCQVYARKERSCLDSCVFAYNTSKHASALYTPFEIMFGRKAVLPIDASVQKDGTELINDFRKFVCNKH